MCSGITAKILDSSIMVAATTRVAKTVAAEETPIEVSINEIDAKSFVPLGIKVEKENCEKMQNVEEHIKIKFEIKNQPASEYKIKIFVKETMSEEQTLLREIYFDKNHKSDMCSMGEHTCRWDGFNKEEKYDSREISKGLLFVIEAEDNNGKKSSTKKEVHVEYVVKWLDVLIDKNEKRIDVWLRVRFKDGGAIGLEKKVPNSAVKRYEYDPIQRTIKSFEDLKKLAKEGLSRYWGSSEGYDKYVNIVDELYKVYVNVVDIPIDDKRKNHMSEIKLTFNTKGELKRSHNPGAIRDIISFLVNIFIGGKVFYEKGYYIYKHNDRSYEIHSVDKSRDGSTLKKVTPKYEGVSPEPKGIAVDKSGKIWKYVTEEVAIIVFKYAVAHEIGHEILQASVNTLFSYTHKDSSTLLTQKPKKEVFPATGKIDLMLYYKNDFEYDDYERIIAFDEDVLRLIGLIKVGAK
jgi:small nuclear ribonucleoprotein (snRNP)-like protein